MSPLSSFAALLLLSSVSVSGKHTCGCTFQVLPEEEEECQLYSALGVTGEWVVSWKRGNQQCLDSYAIDERDISFKDLFQICPNRNGTDFIAAGLLKYLQESEDRPSRLAADIKEKYPEFFETTDNGNSYHLKDTLVNRNGDDMDCLSDQSACWQKISIVVASNPMEGDYVCHELWTAHIQQRRDEQGKLRGALCQDIQSHTDANGGLEESIVDDCWPLAEQIQDFKKKYPGVTCYDLSVVAEGNKAHNNTPKECNVVHNPASGGASLSLGMVVVSSVLLILSHLL